MATPHADEDTRGGLSLDAIGRKLGVSRERVRQIEKAALCKLRKAFHRAGYSDDDLRAALREIASERDARGKHDE